MGEVNEKCAVVGIVAEENVPASLLVGESLLAQQHRGTEATGIVSYQPDATLETRRSYGEVVDVYRKRDFARMSGRFVIGHNRYATSGDSRHQGPWFDKNLTYAVGMNGNLPVMNQLDTYLQKHGVLNTGRFNDADKMGLVIGQQLSNGRDLADAVQLVYPMLRGAFSCVGLHHDMVVAFRDPKGIRPLAIGEFEGGKMFSSETCGLDIADAKYSREVEPGEMVIMTKDGLESRKLADGEQKLDMFELVYFARPDSVLYGRSVKTHRRNFGIKLAEQHGPIHGNTSNVLVVPVPDSSLAAAAGYAYVLGLERDDSIVKNRYIGRTFMAPTNRSRNQQLRIKHNIPFDSMVGRDVILIDDSIVRLNTMPRLVELAKQSGARTVSVLVHSPPVRFPDYYGIDTPLQSELPASYLSVEQMRKRIGCHYLGFLSLSRMVEATGRPAEDFNLSCFTGEYPIGIGYFKDSIQTPVSQEYLD